MSKILQPISKLNAREPKVSGAGMPNRNTETYSKMPGMGCHGSIQSSEQDQISYASRLFRRCCRWRGQ
jgi:hypothetical protein